MAYIFTVKSCAYANGLKEVNNFWFVGYSLEPLILNFVFTYNVMCGELTPMPVCIVSTVVPAW
jgi:hypothetical protein